MKTILAFLAALFYADWDDCWWSALIQFIALATLYAIDWWQELQFLRILESLPQ